jgi:hypothetical protein
MTSSINQIDPEVLAALTASITETVMGQLESKDERDRVERQKTREQEILVHDEYVNKMKTSKDPWVEVVGAVENTPDGVRIALEWNDAFVAYLKNQGINGTDEETVVQHWVTLILRDMAEQMDDNKPEESDFS